jgi:hypothetical protein
VESSVNLSRLLEFAPYSIQVLHHCYWFLELFSVGDYLVSYYVQLLIHFTPILTLKLPNLLQELLLIWLYSPFYPLNFPDPSKTVPS